MLNSIVEIPYLVFGLVVIGVYAGLTHWNPYRMRVRNRVKELEPLNAPGSNKEQANNSVLARFAEELQNLNPSRAAVRFRLQQRLSNAGIYNSAAIPRYFIAELLCTAIPIAVVVLLQMAGYVSVKWGIATAILAAGTGFLMPSFWLDRAVARRHLLLQKSLPDFLDLMIVCLGGGLSLQQTIRQVGDELRLAHPALATEMMIVQRDVELGATVDQALKRFALRTDYDGVRTLSTFLREAQRFGLDIVDALRSHADLLRSQREQAAEEKAQKASVKILIPTLLLIFPAIFVIVVGPAAIQIQEAFIKK